MEIKILGPKQQPAVRAISRRLSKTLEDVYYMFILPSGVYRVKIDKGYIFDGASIPRLLWSILGLEPHGVMDGPALFHDYVYQNQGKIPSGHLQILVSGEWRDCSMEIPRSLADRLLRAFCDYFRVGREDQEWLVWLGVRIGGWFAWMRDDVKRKNKIIIKAALN